MIPDGPGVLLSLRWCPHEQQSMGGEGSSSREFEHLVPQRAMATEDIERRKGPAAEVPSPTILVNEGPHAPEGNALMRGLRALFVERRLPYALEVRIAQLLKRLGMQNRTMRAGGYRVTCRRASMDELFIESVLVREEYFRFHDGFRPTCGQTVIDIGANIGTFALAAARYVGAQGRVVSIEPHPENVRYLKRNIKQNRIGNVTVIEGAVAARDGSVSLFASEESGLHSMRLDHGHGSFAAEAFTLKKIMDRYGIERCDLLKVDCESAEFEIIPAIDRETWRRIRRIAMEYTVPVRDWSFTSPKPEHVALKRSMSADLVRTIQANGFRIDGYYDYAGHRAGYIFATNIEAKN
jgi:FkbM family methyltransferase